MQHSHPILAFKPFILFPPTLYLLPQHPHHRLVLLAVSLCSLFLFLLPGSLKVLQWNDEDLRVRSTKLLHFISSHLVDLICIQESNLNLSFSFLSLDSLQSDRTHSRFGIFLLMSHTLVTALSFSSGRAYPSLNVLPLLFLEMLTPTLNI